MFDTLLIITLFLLGSLLVCLVTLRLSINIKHLSLFSFITDINRYFEIPASRGMFILNPPLIKFNKDLQSPINFYAPPHPPIIRHLRVSTRLSSNVIILKTFLLTISSKIHLFIGQKFFKYQFIWSLK